MEKIVNLKTKDGKIIRSIHTQTKKRNNTVAVFVHGLTGAPNEHIFHNAAKLFPTKGVDVFRPALYWWEKNNRNLSDCSISTHAEDLNKVLQYLRPKYKKIAVIGHSLGSPTILKSNKTLFDSVVLWDPSYLQDGIRKSLTAIKIEGKSYWLSHDQFDYLLSTIMIDEWEWFNGKNELALVENLQKPLLIIAAARGILKEGSKLYFKVAKGKKRYVLVPGATHCFDEEGTETLLLDETLTWVKTVG